MDEKGLEIGFVDREYPRSGFMFEVEDVDGMASRHRDNPYVSGREPLRRGFGHGVEQIVHAPVEHFDQEGEFLQDSAVDVVRPARRVSILDIDPAYILGLGMHFVGEMSIAEMSIAFLQKGVVDLVGAGVSVTVHNQRPNHNTHNDLSRRLTHV